MRNLLAFIVLSVIGFAIPSKVHAWDYSNGTDPYKVVMHIISDNAKGDYEMKRDGEKWVAEFTTTNYDGSIRFCVESFFDGGSSIQRPWGEDYGGPVGTWINYDDTAYDDSNAYFKVTNLRKDSVYKIELKNCEKQNESTGTYNGFQYFVWKAFPSQLYLYNSNPKQIGTAEVVGDVYTCTCYLDEDVYFGFAENANRTDFSQLGTRFGTPVENTAIPASDLVVVRDGDNHMWRVGRSGLYTITFNRRTGRMSATCKETEDTGEKLYLYGSESGWSARLGEGVRYADGTYSFNLYINPEANEYLAFSTNPDAKGWDDMSRDGHKRYTPAIDGVIGNGKSYKCVESEHGAYMVEGDGTYTFIVNLTAGTVDVAVNLNLDKNVNLPLKRVDFENNKKHYFVVGERCGAWHLQPEWELEADESGSIATLSDRFMYDGYIGVAVVDNFDDYKVHRYTLYSNWEYKIHKYANTPGLENIGTVDIQPGQSIYNSPNNGGLVINYDGSANQYGLFDQAYWDGYGQFVTAITVSLDGDGNPTGMKFTEGTEKEQAENRVFTLCGDNIYNRNYSIDSGVGTTCRANHDRSATMDGWQEGWIQYDPVTKKPYIDGNGEYLYHTSFTPDYLTSNPVYFNMATRVGEFQFTNASIQFIEASKLQDLDNDPYRYFYSAFSGKEEIGAENKVKLGEGYSFRPVVENDNPVTTPTNEWHCYVIRDMWMGGQYKFWSGWGGNIHETNGVPDEPTGATWHGPNGGPNLPEHARKRSLGFDVTTGGRVVLYKNAQNRNDANYYINETDDDKTPKYFNRVLLWYNESRDGVRQSYIQLIQEQSGPAIFAQVDENPESGKRNYINYNWYLNPAANDTDKGQKVVSYEIRRYRIIDNVKTLIGMPEGEKVYISDKTDQTVTVEMLYEANAGNLSFTKFTDKGEGTTEGFAPGLYQYDIWVTLESGVRKLATSNRVAIYDNSIVVPDAVAMQLVELRDAYTDYYGDHHESGKDVFSGEISQAGMDRTCKVYLTYNSNDNSNFYLMTIKDDGSGNKSPDKVVMLSDASKAVDFLSRNPDRYLWTSDYYLRCLDYNSYSTTMQRYVDGQIMKSVPEPTLSVMEKVTLDDNTMKEYDHGTARKFDFGEKTYYSAIVSRGGNLSDGVFEVSLTYTYTDFAGNAITSQATKARTGIDPVTPRPFNVRYRYFYAGYDTRDTEGNAENTSRTNNLSDYEWGKIAVPTVPDATKDQYMWAYVRLDDTFDPRELTLQIDFFRPNVNEEITKNYDIRYDITLKNADRTVPLDYEVILHDDAVNDLKNGTQGFDKFPNRYRIEFRGMHPRNGVYPTVEFVKTQYYVPEPGDASQEAPNPEFKTQTGNYGKMIKFEARRTVQVKQEGGLNNVHLGKIKRADGTWDWMYKGHVDFSDAGLGLDETASEYEDQDEVAIMPLYYLIKLDNKAGDAAYYEYLVPHIPEHNHGTTVDIDDKTGLILNDIDPLIGTYIAKGFKSDAAPEISATAIYIYERSVASEKPVATNYNRLETVREHFHNISTEIPAKAPERIKDGITNSGLEHGNAGGLPDTGVAPPDGAKVLDMSACNAATGYNAYIATIGNTFTTSTDGNVTGVEDVLAECDGAEAVYYNLQGIRIDNPAAPGVYMKKQGKTVTKIIVR